MALEAVSETTQLKMLIKKEKHTKLPPDQYIQFLNPRKRRNDSGKEPTKDKWLQWIIRPCTNKTNTAKERCQDKSKAISRPADN